MVAFDTSGSVSDDQLEYFANELNGMIDHVQVDFVQFDTEITYGPKPYTKKAGKIGIEGRGGTNFYPVVDMASEMEYDGLVVFTDGEALFLRVHDTESYGLYVRETQILTFLLVKSGY